jgi:hypothetical protein
MRSSLAVLSCGAALLLGSACGVAAAEHAAPLHGSLATRDTRIRFDAGEHAPRLLALQQPGALPWPNLAQEALPQTIVVNGASQSVAWQLDRAASRVDSRAIRLVYRSGAPRLRLEWIWRARAAYGPLEHHIEIQNLSDATLELPLFASLDVDWRVSPATPLQRFWVEKGQDTPSAEGTHLDDLKVGDRWAGYSSSYARPLPDRPREMIPYALVQEPGGDRRGWYVGIESSARTRITLERTANSLRGAAGLDTSPDASEASVRTRVPPGGTFETPTLFLGAFSGGPDDAGNVLRRWVRAVLNNSRTTDDPRYPLLVNNSWGSGTAVDEALARRMIVDSSQLGLEMFHLDAGWFRDVGDWHADPEKFPRGIASIADFAHGHGLKFGLWMDWTQAGTSTFPGALSVNDPVTRSWLIADPPAGWQHREPFKGITLDLGLPAVQAWAAAELERVVRDYHLDMLEQDGYLVAQGTARTDHPATPPEPGTLHVYEDSGFLFADASNGTDVSYHAARGYYDVYRQLRAHHPALLLEICNDGGRMVDFGSAAHGDYFSIADKYDPLSNRRAFFDASYVLPPAMLESYVEKWPAPRIENFRYQLRSGMQGWFSLMLDTGEWSATQRTEARSAFALYKSALRPLIRSADLYHVSARPDGVHWDGIEYFSARLRRGVLYAFRGTGPDEATHRYRLAGLSPLHRYRLRFQDRGAAADQVLGGRELMETGVEVGLPLTLSSELIFIEEVS